MVAQLDPRYIRRRPGKALSRAISHGLFQGRPLTTRARWLNGLLRPLLRAMSRRRVRLPAGAQPASPVFIVGMGRTGSTVLGKVLSMHRDVTFLNEPKLLWHVAFPHEDLIGSYSRGPAHYRLDASHVDDGVRDRARHLHRWALALTDARRVVDKYPALVFRIPFVKAIFPDAQVLFLTRNGWDTVRSVARWSQRYGTVMRDETYDWWGVDRRKWRLLVEQVVAPDPAFAGRVAEIAAYVDPIAMAAVAWTTAMREGLTALATRPEDVHRVRFEVMTQEPGATLAHVAEICGLPEDGVFLSYARETLAPVPPKPPVDLPDAIRPLFLETMAALGY
jgi:hypothetical protein